MTDRDKIIKIIEKNGTYNGRSFSFDYYVIQPDDIADALFCEFPLFRTEKPTFRTLNTRESVFKILPASAMSGKSVQRECTKKR